MKKNKNSLEKRIYKIVSFALIGFSLTNLIGCGESLYEIEMRRKEINEYIERGENQKESKIKNYLQEEIYKLIDVDRKPGISFEEKVRAYKTLKEFENYLFVEGEKFPELTYQQQIKILQNYSCN